MKRDTFAGTAAFLRRRGRSPSAAESGASTSAQGVGPGSRKIILVGNPNVGKSVVFKNLTGQRVIISNYPGTTVEITSARVRLNGSNAELLDTPGVNDLAQSSEDARVTREILAQHPGALLVQVADAKNLRRALLLTLQLAELRRPMVLVLNMMDELWRRGGRIQIKKLSRILGIPVVRTIAVHNSGTDRVLRALRQARAPEVEFHLDRGLQQTYERNQARLECAGEILSQTYSLVPPKQPPFAMRLGFWAMHPLKGLLVLGVLLATVFWFVGLLGAGTLVNLLEVNLFEQRLSPLAIRGVDAVLPFPHTHELEQVTGTTIFPLTPAHGITLHSSTREVIGTAYTVDPSVSLSFWQEVLRFLHDFLVGQYGVITMAVSYALAIVLPIVTTFFLMFSLLEDSGYLPRLSIMVNRLFRMMGLSGKAVLPMVLGLGCDTMATMTTRILETRRDRLVTTLLLALAVPCSAQLGVLLAMMAQISVAAVVVWAVLIVAVIFAVGWLTARIFGGEGSDFILEIPPMRMPQAGNVVTKTLSRLEWYLKEILPLFILGTAILFLLDRLGLLRVLAAAGRPLVTGWLGLPPEMINAFLIGFMRRDFGAVYLLDAATGPDPLLDAHQILVAMVTITLFMPCVANLLMIAKEHSKRTALAMTAFIFPFAFLVGGLVHHLGRLVGL
jgi:ferrous iron transport protein B